jgi:hypothetical protein
VHARMLASQVTPTVPDWFLTGPVAPMFRANENVNPAALPPWCSMHGYDLAVVVCPIVASPPQDEVADEDASAAVSNNFHRQQGHRRAVALTSADHPLQESTKLPTACTYANGQRSVPSA